MRENDILKKENMFSYYIIACRRIENVYSITEVIEKLKKEFQSELNYIQKYNLSDDDLLDSTSIDMFNAVYSLMKNKSGNNRYEQALIEKLSLLDKSPYKLIWGDSELLLNRYGILYHIDEKCFYEPYMRLKSIDVDTYNNLWSKERKIPIIFNKIDGINGYDEGDILLVW